MNRIKPKLNAIDNFKNYNKYNSNNGNLNYITNKNNQQLIIKKVTIF